MLVAHASRLPIEVSDELAGAKLGNPHMKAAIDARVLVAVGELQLIELNAWKDRLEGDV